MNLDVHNQQLNGFDLNTLLDSSKKFLTDLTGKPPIIGINGNAPPILLQRPVAQTVTTVNAPLPVATPSFLNTITESIKQLTPSLVSVAQTKISIDAQKKLAKYNVELAKQGKPPIDIATYNEANAPVFKIQGGVDNNTGKYVMYGGVALGAALLFMAMTKK